MFNCFKERDRLIIHDTVPKDGEVLAKSEALSRGIQALQGHVFRPSLWSFNWCLRGNGQTLMGLPLEAYQARREGPFVYDHRELYTLSDGGKIYIDYMGEQFEPTREANYAEADGKEPVFFIVPGLTSHG